MQQMNFEAGAKLGAYEIVGPLGAGGMGAVYRARDSKLKREVAIKVLPDAFAQDDAAVARFQREAEVLASLNHPNIAAIYDLVESGKSRFLVLELVEGETLAERISRGPIPIVEALGIAKQIAEALEAAHEKGIIHRDLKPANVKLAPGGMVKVLDFGLAKTRAAEADLSSAPTMASATMPGMILGTAAYMPPEQAKGHETDRTSDVWSFGCVLYEMLVGRPVFEGATVSETLAEVLKGEPGFGLLPGDTPEGIRRLLRRCLQRDQKIRLRDIGDARIEIGEAQSAPVPGRVVLQAPNPPASRMKERILWISLAVFALIAVTLGVRALHPVPPSPEMRVEINTAPTFSPTSLAISPDGQKIAFAAQYQGRSQLWLRSLDSVVARPLAGTGNPYGANPPFWSPDNRSIGFFADGKLKRIDIDSGSVKVLANAPNPRGGTWSQDGTILFAPVSPGVISQISASGGKQMDVTQLEGPQAYDQWPQFLPDGRHFIYYVFGADDIRGVYLRSLGASKSVRLFDADSAAVYASSGHLLFVQKGMLLAQGFDADRQAPNGNPFPVGEQVSFTSTNIVAVSASPAGPIVYRGNQAAPSTSSQFGWFDRTGKLVGNLSDLLTGNSHWSLSPDGRNFAQERSTNGNNDIWRIDLARGVRNQFTSDPAPDTFPVWSPKGDRIAFTSNRKSAVYDLYQGLADKPGSEELLLATSENKIATDWSADGRYLLYRNFNQDSGYDIWALPLDGNGKRNGEPLPIVRTPADERDGQFSPDGKWIAYQSNDTGAYEVYVQPFPGPGPQYQVSKGGGAQARWNWNGKELFYVAPDGKLMSVSMRLDSSGLHVEAGVPVPLFLTTMRGPEVQSPNRQQYAVASDGQRFLMRSEAISPNTLPLTLILNWKAKP
jgi:serine/threonine protein kinase